MAKNNYSHCLLQLLIFLCLSEVIVGAPFKYNSDKSSSPNPQGPECEEEVIASPASSPVPPMEILDSAQSQPKQIFILSGQSNMAGRAGVINGQWEGPAPPECAPDEHKIFRLTAALDWEVARDPLHFDIDINKTCGVGPGMSFANAIKDRVGVIGLVPCAVGGTRIKQWARGGQLYENMVRRAKAAVDLGGEIKAVLWYQGESDTSDTTTQQDVDEYKGRMEALIQNVRADLNLPSLPFIQVALASGSVKKFLEEIRGIQKGIEMPNVVCVDAMGLPLRTDNLHLETEGEVKLGHMLADAYLTNFLPS